MFSTAFDLHDHYPAYKDAETALVMPSRRWELPAAPALDSVQDILETIVFSKNDRG